MAVDGIGVAYVTAGFVFAYAGFRNTSVKSTLTSFLHGSQPAARPTGPVTVTVGQAGQADAAGATAVPSGTGAVNGCTAAQTAANKATGKLLATAYGWGSGAQWDALDGLVMLESGWCNTAQNPGSTAYGIGQFLDTTWASAGYAKTSNPVTQISAMLAYIKQRYGTPAAAYSFHIANGWY